MAEEELKNVSHLLGIEIEPPKDPEAILSEKDRGKQGDLAREVRKFSLLTGTLQNLLEANDEDTIVRAAQQSLKVLFDTKRILFFLYDPEKKGLICKATEEENNSFMIGNLIIPMQADKSLLATSLTKGKPLDSFTDFADTKPIITQMRKILEQAPSIKIEYTSIVDAETLQKIDHIEAQVLAAVAVQLGPARLIDNIIVDASG